MPDQGERIDALLAEMRGLNRRIDEGRTNPRQADGGREVAAGAGQEATAKAIMEAWDAREADRAAKAKADIDAAVKAALAEIRTPSMAAAIGQGKTTPAQIGRAIFGVTDEAHAAMKAAFREYQSGELLTALLDVHSIETGGIDFDSIQRGKAALASLGAQWWGVPEASKATLGATGATGGYVLPNNLVDTLIKPNVQQAIYQNLVTVRTGVAVRGVDLPFRTGAPTRMQFQDWGSTKENVNEAYGSYTATLATMARIYDIGKQYARFSAGSAERDVIDELGKAAILGENYYILAGAGTGAVGSGDPTLGVYTLLNQQFGNYTTAFTASSSTVAGSAAAGLAKAFQALASRSRYPDAVVTDAITYWTIFSQGSDNAGFWMSELLGAGFQISPDNSLKWRGVPILFDSNFNTNSGTTKAAIAGEWNTLKLFRGMEFRIDTSDVANTRWDQNLIGFRGEEEIGINAAPAVLVGAFQLITGLIP